MASPAYNSAYDAITRGDDDAFRKLLGAHPGLERERGERIEWPNATLLEHAIWFHQNDIARQLIDAGAPLDATGSQPPMTPLQRALEMGATEIAQALGAPTTHADAAALNRPDAVPAAEPADVDERRRAFRLACINGARDAAIGLAPERWCSKEALVDTLAAARHLLTWDEGATEWDWARYQLELADPANVFEFDHDDGKGRTLRSCAEAGGTGELLPDAPALAGREPPSMPWRAHNTAAQEAFLFACQWGQTERVRALLADNPQLITTQTMWNFGPLYLPGAYGSDGSTATALLLLEAGATPYDGIGGPAWWGSADMVTAMLDRGAPPELPDSFESGLLHACAATRYNDYAEAEHWLPIIDALLDAGADPNFPNRYRITPWGFVADALRPHLAARGADPVDRVPGVVDLFTANDRAKVQLAAARPELLRLYDYESGCSVALHALVSGQRALGERLLALKPAPDLNEAAAIGDVHVLSARLDALGQKGPRAGADPEGAPLHFATVLGHAEAAELLSERGYSPIALNGADFAGDYIGPSPLRDTTAAHVAAETGNSTILARFIDRWREHWGL